ncbi:GtrA family protein [Xanthomonas sp. NCPPB 2632]|jgi:putative flippase GtrA|uniref:GtrA family protein n=1 Tax=Xanthomonas sp. NCPPB 2632 TaxID=3240912 RepID=UPI003517F76B
MIKRLAGHRLVRFVLAGGTSAVVNFVSRIFFNQWMGFSAAVILAYVVGMITAFVLTRTFVFGRGQQSTARSAMFFFLVNLIAVAQTWAISILMADYALPAMGVTSYVHNIAHAIGVMIPVLTSYIGHKRWSFR